MPITLTGSDIDGDALTFQVVAQPTNGTLSGTAPDLTYTPNADFNGADSFTITANDGTVDSLAATIDIDVTPENDAPTANDATVDAVAGVAVAVPLTGQDVDGDALTFAVVTQPANGVLTGPATALEYTANPGFSGVDQFTFVANDGTVGSAPATITLQVTSSNNAPVFTQIPLLNAPLGETYRGFGIATDPDGDPITIALTNGPAGSSLTDLGNGQFEILWISAGNIGDSTPFTVTATDSSGGVGTLNLDLLVTGDRINRSHR